MDVWAGDIELPGGGRIENVELVSENPVAFSMSRTPIQFLATVDMTRIPLYMAIESPMEVYSERQATQVWFNTLLLDHFYTDDAEAQWWQDFQNQSPVGILAKAHDGTKAGSGPKLTEILFFASAEPKGLASSFSSNAPQTPTIRLLAVPLSSDLLHPAPAQSSPPLSPNASPVFQEQEEVAQFLPQSATTSSLEARKRESVSNIFDEAEERRKRARRKGGQSVAAAASRANEPIPQLKRSTSSNLTEPPLDAKGRRDSPNTSFSQPATKTSRSLSRSPSVNLEIRPASRREGLDSHAKRSSLSRVASVADLDSEPTIESRNKDTISRLVMAGMRMYGLHQRKRGNKAHARRASVAPGTDSQAGQHDEDVTLEDAARDEEYKLVYHQTYRGAVFAMRKHMSTRLLGQYVDELRDVVDKLLAIFCNDPLPSSYPQSPGAEPTPGNVKGSFGTPNLSETKSPFVQQANHFNGDDNPVHTPVVRRTAR
ncbi:hypothetical protein HDK90DRAFT_484024 [Phyllosticta capitalensis]|uniref:Sld7 C-terminal domain-containing protein n=2 Tax=Phyllosticta capitalensis TaxID=121624 RepID=A0ABR1YPF1_9PEZI